VTSRKCDSKCLLFFFYVRIRRLRRIGRWVAESQFAPPPVSRELSVPITGSFDSETDRVVVGAFAMTCAALRLELDDNLKLLIASKIIELAKAGETNLDRLCERTLVGFRDCR